MTKVVSVWLNDADSKLLEDLCIGCGEPNQSKVMRNGMYALANGGNKAKAESDDGLKLDLSLPLRTKAIAKQLIEEKRQEQAVKDRQKAYFDKIEKDGQELASAMRDVVKARYGI